MATGSSTSGKPLLAFFACLLALSSTGIILYEGEPTPTLRDMYRVKHTEHINAGKASATYVETETLRWNELY